MTEFAQHHLAIATGAATLGLREQVFRTYKAKCARDENHVTRNRLHLTEETLLPLLTELEKI